MPHVLVIGGGMAGLVTARILHDTGFDVTVLEARPRLGGRLWTSKQLGVACDVGATWITDPQTHPVGRWCRQAGHPLTTLSFSPFRFYHDGASQSLGRILWQGRHTAARAGRILAQARIQSASRRSLADVFQPLLEDVTLQSLDRRLLAWGMALAEAQQSATAQTIDPRALSWPRRTERAILKNGFGSLLQQAATGLDVRLETPANMLAYGGDGVVARTPAGRFEAEAAVVTTPLGVLRDGPLLFNPPLGYKRESALDRLAKRPEGILNKAVFRFPHCFWPKKRPWLAALPDEDEARGLFSVWLNLAPVTAKPLIMGFLSGSVAARLDRRGADRALRARGLKRLRRMFGQKAVPEPDGFLVTRWLSDIWAQGSFSHDTPETHTEDRRRLAAPLADRVFFAGAATHPEAPGTVKGALLSGERAAREVHKRYCNASSQTGGLPWHD